MVNHILVLILNGHAENTNIILNIKKEHLNFIMLSRNMDEIILNGKLYINLKMENIV